MESAERIEKLAATMREFNRDREELGSFTLGAVRGCVDVIARRGDLDDSAVLDRIREVLAAEEIVRAERR